jgi:hypothetical protein
MSTIITRRLGRGLASLLAVPALAVALVATPASADIDNVNISPSETVSGTEGTLTVSGNVDVGATFVAIAQCDRETAVLGTDCNDQSGSSVLVPLGGATSFEEEIDVTSTFSTMSFVPGAGPEAATVVCADEPGGNPCAVVIVEYTGTFPAIVPRDTVAVDITFDV